VAWAKVVVSHGAGYAPIVSQQLISGEEYMNRAIFLILALLPVLFLFNCKKDTSSITGISDPDSLGPTVKKPNIYIYPIEAIDLSVQISFPNGGKILESIPDYNGAWEIHVLPSGLINNEYEYLFYEAQIPELLQRDFGWVISGTYLESFFINNLDSLKFSMKEIDDFVEYWIPLLDDKKKYIIYPQFSYVLDDIVQLKFSKKPDNVIRVFYLIEEHREGETKNIPQMPSTSREGFTIMEWGVVH